MKAADMGRVRELVKGIWLAHPGWTRAQVVAAVRDRLAQLALPFPDGPWTIDDRSVATPRYGRGDG